MTLSNRLHLTARKLSLLVIFGGIMVSINAEKPELTKITRAIKRGNIDYVRSLWEEIKQTHSLKESQDALDDLIRIVSEEKVTEQSALWGSGKIYGMLISGALLHTAGISLWRWAVLGLIMGPSQATILGGATYASLIGGYHLFKWGWHARGWQGDYRAKLDIIKRYFEKEQEKLDEEDYEDINKPGN